MAYITEKTTHKISNIHERYVCICLTKLVLRFSSAPTTLDKMSGKSLKRPRKIRQEQKNFDVSFCIILTPIAKTLFLEGTLDTGIPSRPVLRFS